MIKKSCLLKNNQTEQSVRFVQSEEFSWVICYSHWEDEAYCLHCVVIIIIISLFKVDFYITFCNYKKPINFNLPRKLEKKLRYTAVCKFINLINQLTILFISQHRPFNGGKI